MIGTNTGPRNGTGLIVGTFTQRQEGPLSRPLDTSHREVEIGVVSDELVRCFSASNKKKNGNRIAIQNTARPFSAGGGVRFRSIYMILTLLKFSIHSPV